jgi:hypothetical protein
MNGLFLIKRCASSTLDGISQPILHLSFAIGM